MPDDSRATPRDFLAVERTFLAWIRTGLALMGLGFVLARFGIFLREFSLNQPNLQAQSYGLSLVRYRADFSWCARLSALACPLPPAAAAAFNSPKPCYRAPQRWPSRPPSSSPSSAWPWLPELMPNIAVIDALAAKAAE